MSDIIKLLPEAVANQIAAGEVVQRPASVVKELVENAIDAEASKITVIVKDAGKLLIQVIDNGIGMSESDAKMSLERHATSKIRKAEDLFSIHTKGFRGEAMASIAAVAQMELKTRPHGAEVGTRIKIEGSEIKDQSEDTCPEGTSIAVRNLFYNVPARRNFLKSNAVEMRHITEEFQRLALSHAHISFELYHNDLSLLSVLKSKLSQRIISIFGKNYQQQLAPIEEETPDLKITGYIGRPEYAKKGRGEQFFFVNNRFIKSPYLYHSVATAFESMIPKDSYPFYVIFIDIDPKMIDINVHPTKTEIKFDDDRLIYGILNSSVKKSLGFNNLAHSLDFQSDTNTNFGVDNLTLNKTPSQENQASAFNPRNFSSSGGNKNEGWEKLYAGLQKNTDTESSESSQQEQLFTSSTEGQHSSSTTFSSKMNDPADGNNVESGHLERSGSVMQVLGKYIVTQVKSGMLLINQNKAHQRVLFERYISTLKNKYGASQQFLFPQSIELSASDYGLVMELEEDIKNLGFVFNDFGQNTIVLNGIPADAPSGKEKELFEGLLESFKENQELDLNTQENLARALAKRSAIKEGSKLNSEEMNTIINELFACQTPEYSSDGKRTMTILNETQILGLFG